MSEKTIAIRIDEELHKEIKLRLAENGMTLKDYIISLIKTDINESKKLNLKAIPFDNTVTQESIKEAQKVLDFVSDIVNHSYSDKKK